MGGRPDAGRNRPIWGVSGHHRCAENAPTGLYGAGFRAATAGRARFDLRGRLGGCGGVPGFYVFRMGNLEIHHTDRQLSTCQDRLQPTTATTAVI